MNKIFSILGYLILVFLLLSNHMNITLTDAIAIVLGVLGAAFMCVGILLKDKKDKA